MATDAILIVDDTPVNLKLMRILLANEGFNALTAGSAEEALEILRTHRPLLILADIQLPAMDGLELTRRIKSDEGTRAIPVVALTAFATKNDEQRALAAGCDGYITKPIDTRTFGARIREFIRRGPDGLVHSASFNAAELQPLRRRFIAEGVERTREYLRALDERFPIADASRTVHQWVGTSGLLGFTGISQLSRQAEAILAEKPFDGAELRETLQTLLNAFERCGEDEKA
jgi:CheY-like chemotaxis protein